MAQPASDITSGPSVEGLFSFPAGWKAEHTRFVGDLAERGEDAGSILILFQTEFPAFEVKGVERLEGVIRKITVGAS